MKKLLYTYIALFIGSIFISSCEQNKDILIFNTEDSYLYFNLPNKLDQFGRPEKDKYVDSLVYSFALDLEDVTTYTFKVPLAVSGTAANVDRSYTIEVVEEETTATDSDWLASSIENNVIRKGNQLDTLLITVNRTEVLKTDWRSVVLRIKANDNFMLGREDLLKVKLSFTDILQPPVWWSYWEDIFGPFYLETYLKWQEIYYKGADLNKPPSYIKVSKDPNETYYWDNMPIGYYAGSERSLPSTFMFIAIMRDYFEKNEVYGTNPDGSKTRIKIH